MSVQDLMEEGWGGLDSAIREPSEEDEASIKRALQEQFEKDNAYLKCFSSAEGRVVLDDLQERFIFRNSYNPGIVNPNPHGHYFEGHRNLVLAIIERMKRARKGSPIQPEIEL